MQVLDAIRSRADGGMMADVALLTFVQVGSLEKRAREPGFCRAISMQLEDRFPPPKRFVDSSDLLHELVAAEVGSSDFGTDDYLAGLKVLLVSMDFDPRFSERGRRIAWGELIGALSARAHAIRSMDRCAKSSPTTYPAMPGVGAPGVRA